MRVKLRRQSDAIRFRGGEEEGGGLPLAFHLIFILTQPLDVLMDLFVLMIIYSYVGQNIYQV